jgi:hypothetical protein
VARKFGIEGLEPPPGAEQQLRRLAAKTGGPGDVAADEVRPGLLGLVEWPVLRAGDKPEGGIERASLKARLCRGERALGTSRRVHRQCNGTL